MSRHSRWTWAWVAWLVAFLSVEVPAAIRKPKGDTLSENVWVWFRGWRRVPLALFMLTLTSHFVFEWPGGLGVILTGAPIALVIALGMLKKTERPE